MNFATEIKVKDRKDRQPPDAAGVRSEMEFAKTKWKENSLQLKLLKKLLCFCEFYFREPKGPAAALGVLGGFLPYFRAFRVFHD